jgi:hypothetical protein
LRPRNILILAVVLAALGVYFYVSTRPEPIPEPEPQVFAWLIEADEIERIEIRLPHEGLSQTFIKDEDRSWHFDDEERSAVDMERWGGGIPLLLSGPGVARVIAENATQEQLTEFGITNPQMEIVLNLGNERMLYIQVGNTTPDGSNFYIKAPKANDVATVDISWYEVIERLIKEPPYASAEAADSPQ